MGGASEGVWPQGRVQRESLLIFVTTGSGPLDFSRLVRKMDEIAGDLGEEIIIQKGFTPYETQSAKSFSFVPYEQALDFFKKAEVVVGHASAGPIMHAREFNKPLIVFPRNGELKELIDDHQIETAKAIEGSSRMIEVIFHEDDLKGAVQRAMAKAEAGLSYEESPALSSLIRHIRDFVQRVRE